MDLNSTFHPDGHICQNCNQVVERVTLVPEFDYMGCDECMAEALAVIASEKKPVTVETSYNHGQAELGEVA